MRDAIVFDIETKKDPAVDGWNTATLGVGVGIVYEVARDRFLLYDDSPASVAEFRARVLRADAVGGFNIWSFDYPVLFGLSKDDFAVSDICRQARSSAIIFDVYRLARLGLNCSTNGPGPKGLNMDSISQLTLGLEAAGGKGCDSAKLPGMLQAGRLSAVLEECQRHVALERDLCRFLLRHGYIIGQTAMTDPRRIEFAPDAELWANYPPSTPLLGSRLFG